MSKIICDICGTSYADTATQCPICGCVRPAQTSTVPDEQTENGGYTYVKGGRFSKTNVRKRNSAEKAVAKNENNDGKKGPFVLLIAIILIGIVAICVILWASGIFGSKDDSGEPQSTPAPTAPVEPTDPVVIPSQAITITNKELVLKQIGDTAVIDCRKIPADSTDVITYIPEDETIVSVDENGQIVALNYGTTVITVVCGNVRETCMVTVGELTELVLSETDVLLTVSGQTINIYDGAFPAEMITWTIDNDFPATVENGVVTAQNPGIAIVTATYKDMTATCRVECSFDFSGSGSGGITEDGSGTTENGGVSEDGENVTTTVELVTWDQLGPFRYKNDTTLQVGETQTLYLGNSDGTGERITLEWTCKANDYISVSGNTVKALKSTNRNPITVTAVYEGRTYSCYVRVP